MRFFNFENCKGLLSTTETKKIALHSKQTICFRAIINF
ncbi:hypothetical protein C900_03335 [Fulvivirga imtechensis AK7]|uniref:Uncharacterized protein n=1 Tax=Fulvivirga imtechensis AK7 TaxID=1237149 RepID=L8JPY4_9BACT|nr:hypothetical protein C900_03335 [Fulvivirga imtechensis AK7]